MNQQLLTVSKDSSICTGISELLKNGHMVLKNNKRNNELDMTHQSSPTKLAPLPVLSPPRIPPVEKKSSRVFEPGELHPQNRFESKPKRVKANFNNDLMGVAEEKVKHLEIASIGSHETIMTNSERIERLLKSNRSTNNLKTLNQNNPTTRDSQTKNH